MTIDKALEILTLLSRDHYPILLQDELAALDLAITILTNISQALKTSPVGYITQEFPHLRP